VKPREVLGRSRTAEGTELTLVQHGDEYIIMAAGQVLMSSRTHASEEALAVLGCARARALASPHVLVGGLGMGFTLRAALEILPGTATVVLAELVPAVVRWNRGPVGPLANHPLRDPRVRIEDCDVRHCLRASTDRFDAVLLDVDNGPTALTSSSNDGLYSAAGIAAVRTSLRPGGVLAVWSARDDRAFEARLRAGGFDVRRSPMRSRAHTGARVIVAVNPDPSSPSLPSDTRRPRNRTARRPCRRSA
jgi:spermidine synthase